MKRLLTLASIILLLAVSASGQSVSVPADSRIGARDVLDISVLQDEKLTLRGATVSEQGVITMPAIGKVEVAGLTIHQVEQRLKSILEARVLKQADVSVQIAQFGNRPISIVGAVNRPGTINNGGGMTLIQAITQAGGLTTGFGKSLIVLRTGLNGLTEQIDIDIDDLLVRGDPDLNIPLEANDVINVAVQQPLIIYMLGEVMHPGKIDLPRNPIPSLLQAISSAGGPTDRASNKVFIKRAGVRKPIPVNFRRISEGDAPDVPLQDGDTITLKESLF